MVSTAARGFVGIVRPDQPPAQYCQQCGKFAVEAAMGLRDEVYATRADDEWERLAEVVGGASTRECEPVERSSGGIPSDEPEHGWPPIVSEEGTKRVPAWQNDADSAVNEVSEESFAARDVPWWIPAVHARGK